MNKNKIRISILIISYNMDKYLWRCLISVLLQSFKSIEIIVINNGSTDETKRVLSLFCFLSKKIRVVNLVNNIGLPQARNMGLSLARGEYVTFVDADDLVHIHFAKIMYNTAKSNNADLVTCNVDTFSNSFFHRNNLHPMSWFQKSKRVMTIRDCPEQLFELAAWSKLVRKDLYCNIKWRYIDDSLFCEDVPVSTELFLTSKSICTIPQSLYFYRIRKDSLSHHMTSHQIDDFIFSMSIQSSLVKKFEIHDVYFFRCLYETRLLLAMLIFSRIRESDISYYFQNLHLVFDEIDQMYLDNLFICMPDAKDLYTAIISRKELTTRKEIIDE